MLHNLSDYTTFEEIWAKAPGTCYGEIFWQAIRDDGSSYLVVIVRFVKFDI